MIRRGSRRIDIVLEAEKRSLYLIIELDCRVHAPPKCRWKYGRSIQRLMAGLERAARVMTEILCGFKYSDKVHTDFRMNCAIKDRLGDIEGAMHAHSLIRGDSRRGIN